MLEAVPGPWSSTPAPLHRQAGVLQVVRPHGSPGAWRAPSIFFVLHMLGVGNPSQKPGIQPPPRFQVQTSHSNPPLPSNPTMGPQVYTVFYQVDPPLSSPH